MTDAGYWPRTTRVLPWMLALFVCLIWLVPTESIQLSVSLPIDPLPDRFLLGAIALLWVFSLATGRSLAPGSPALNFSRALAVFGVLALASVLLNLDMLERLGEIEQATKKLFVLVAYATLFLVVATTLRPAELPHFAMLLVGLAALTAVGTIYEYRTNFNVFYDVAGDLWGGVATVAPPPREDGYGRIDTFGPTDHGLAITTMLAMVLPFAVLRVSDQQTRGRKILLGVAVALILAAGFATLRKTSGIAPLVALAVLVAYRPRQMAKLAPLGLVLVIAIHFITPAALGSVFDQFTGGFFEAGTTQGRTADYEAVSPDVAKNPVLGRGYGSIVPERDDTYRILDNEYLGLLVQMGFLGVAAYLAMIAAALALAHRTIKRGPTPTRRSIALAAAGGFAAFGVASTLFDVFSFPQVPYLFFFIAGMCSVAASEQQAAPAPEPVLAQPVPAT